MKIATWNINSVRLRIQLVIDFLNESQTDILCLQETKTEDQHFPADALAEAGWQHQAFRGEKSYNGVAIISRTPLSDIQHVEWAGKNDCRHISALTQDGTRIHNFYIPAGGDIPDRTENPKFGHKMDFLSEMTSYFVTKKPEKSVLVGDLNIAPLAEDVWSSKQLLKVVSHTPIETDSLKNLMAEGGWNDAIRAHFGPEEKLFSWWSYRSRDWAASNRGRRLDHIWVSDDLASQVTSAIIHQQYRGVEKPSDHVPMTIDL